MVAETRIKSDEIVAILRELPGEELTRLQQLIRREKKRRTKWHGKRLTGYVPKRLMPYYPIVLDWLYKNGFIEEKNDYNFATLAFALLIEQVVKQIRQKPSQNTTSTEV
ncbi:MAG: hypothetical protein ACXQTS_06920 [Candidatus Methanospirareceae archaeon]